MKQKNANSEVYANPPLSSSVLSPYHYTMFSQVLKTEDNLVN